MSGNSGIIPLTTQKVPSILYFDRINERFIIGDDARALGLKGRTNAFNFKPDLGDGDAAFSQKKKYWIVPDREYNSEEVKTLTAKEVTIYFLKELLKNIKVPSEIIIGEPAERDNAWKENFRRHMRDVLDEVCGIKKPQFMPEPFAVFQYYRHYEQVFSAQSKPEIVLIIDIGGGTFNSCVISTTEAGAL
jgi:molecular chaperone DnaK (HSP70)